MKEADKNAKSPKSRNGRGAFALPTFSPWKFALTVAITYLGVGIAYIIASGYLAAEFAESIRHLKHIEFIKGIGFIVFTALLLLLLLYVLLRRIAYKERVCAHQREALILSENRALAGMFASSVAHDINNVLMVLDYAVEQLARERSDHPDHAQRIKQLQETNERIKELTTRLGQAASPEPPDVFDRVDLIETIEKTVDLARTHNRVRTCTLELKVDESITLDGNSVMIHQMLLNLIINAADACEHQGRIKVSVHRDDGYCVIEVHDSGHGIPESERASIFTPFYTTKHEGKGLGLLSVKSCADAHHGTIEVTESPLGGACFRIKLPMQVDAATAAPSYS